MKEIKYSFIIPAHNCDKFIVDTVNGILEDNIYNNIEIIVIENGSEDKTINILNENFKNKENVIITSSEKGVSNARNKGIELAKGKYIIFVDADDKWLRGSLEKITESLKEECDILLCGFIKGKEREPIEQCKKIIHFNEDTDVNKIKEWIISKPTLRAQAWAKVYKKDILTDNNIYFNTNLSYAEDSEFVLRVLKVVNNIKIESYPIYKYVLSETSAMRSANPNRIKNYIDSMNYSKKEYENIIDFEKAIDKYILTHLNIILVHDVFASNKNTDKKKDMMKFKELINLDIFKDSLNKIKIRECLSKELCVEVFIKLKLYFLVALLCYKKSEMNQK